MSQTVLNTHHVTIRRLLYSLFGKRMKDVPIIPLNSVLLRAMARGYIRVRENQDGLWLHITDLGEMIVQDEMISVKCPVCHNEHDFCIDTSEHKYCVICSSPLEATISALD